MFLILVAFRALGFFYLCLLVMKMGCWKSKDSSATPTSSKELQWEEGAPFLSREPGAVPRLSGFTECACSEQNVAVHPCRMLLKPWVTQSPLKPRVTQHPLKPWVTQSPLLSAGEDCAVRAACLCPLPGQL